MIATYNETTEKLCEQLNKEYDPFQYKLWVSKENKHVHFIYCYEKGELDTNEKIKEAENKLTLCSNEVYETISDVDLYFNDVYNPSA